ncbi:MAG TPA: M20/M25/M40 family metallo-hydrolase [Gaiella sp.]|uniref:M20/M25/M40 family metallo-hydrolase n=1 Tax=Gaiella sp. TaxID=2663207 RepID=UPI002D7FA0D5|nr:M20/M25/M40 family metallo-hydrolase [Gaiella sp.]HET9286121.1 M20/M25/M40 family metallo-hydrolase [Gaiella sp.]
MTLRDEVTTLLQELLRLDTVNPPGNEARAAELLREYLTRNGLESRLVARSPERANLVARLEGGGGPTLLLLAHTDTVLADASEWARDPWSGDLVDGEVWGRGALDMKGHVAAAAVAVASLAREGARLPGDVLLALTADEEVGLDFGASWLASEHPEALRADFALNEGGGERCVLGGRVYYLCAVGEKATAPFKLHLRGRSGHASDPYSADNALLKAAPVLEALGRLELPRSLIPEVKVFLETVLGEVPPLEEALARAADVHPLAAQLLAPLLSATLSPTMIEASRKRNVIPGSCVIEVDCRLLPGQPPAEMEALLRAGIPDDWELEWIVAEQVGGTRSPLHTPLWRALETWVEGIEPGARLAPIVTAGFTDSHYVRSSLGATVYGFFPLRTMDTQLAARLVHSADERIAVDDLELGVDLLRHVATTPLT